jgi:hypothetical protein
MDTNISSETDILNLSEVRVWKASLVGSKEIGLEVKADKTKYMVMSRDENAG